jgi:ferric-dicitrate binding protein FerR (iron transport regulator)
MDQDQFLRIAGRVLSGEATPDEVRLLNNWIAASEQHWYAFEMLRMSWKETQIRHRVSNQDRVFRNILSGIDETHENSFELQEQSISEQRHKKDRFSMDIVFFRYAAAIVVFITALFAAVHFVSTKTEAEAETVAMVTKSNRAGQKSQIHLPDGTTVWLNAESAVTYPESFESALREVWLEGEAYFEVHKDTIKPFRVHTGLVCTEVLGTAFNVTAYPEEQTIRVSLTKGKVMVSIRNENKIKEIPLDPGEQFSYNRTQNNYKTDVFDPMVTTGWKDGVIYFKKASFEEVVRTLSRWYDVQFTVVNPGLQPEWSYTGTFKNDYLDNILKNMSFAKGFDYSLDDKSVVVTFN